MKKNIPLRDFVYRTLVLRISVAALLIALLMMVGVFFLERDRNNAKIKEYSADGASMVNQAVIGYLDGDESKPLQILLDQISSPRVKHPDGSFIYYEIYDLDGKTLARIEDESYPGLDAARSVLSNVSRITDVSRLPLFKRARLNNIPHVGVVLPLFDSMKQPGAFMLGVYAVSDRAIDNFQKKLWRSFTLVIFIVFITSALLYPVVLRLTKKLSNFSSELLTANLDMLETLGSAIAKRDSDTNAHNYRVTIIAVRLAEKLALTSMQIQGLIKGAFLHDIGKIGIRDDVLLKPGKLDDEEFLVMKKHVDHGVDIVKQSGWLKDAVEVVASHHEKCDGSGYPDGKQLDGIPVSARIFAIADVFDALTSKRPYKEPFSFEKTMAIMRESKGSHFDAAFIEAFEDIAESLYSHLSGREDEGLREEVLAITGKYFSSGLDVLKRN